MFELKRYSEIYDIAKDNNEFTVNLSNLSMRDSLRVIDFLAGLTLKNGKLKKLSVHMFKVSY